MFSPMQSLLADGVLLPAPLMSTDTDTSIVQDPLKLRAMNKKLQGKPCRLLPDER
jgi:hypothetical protein